MRAFLSEGLRRNERVWFIGDGSEVDLLGRLGDGFADRVCEGAVRVTPIAEAYTGAVPPQRQVERFAESMQAALADGFTALRVAADSTALANLRNWNRYEHLVDRYMIGRPLIGLCGFHAGKLSAATVAELECLHPVTNTAEVGFRLTAHPAAHRLTLSGELDITGHDVLVRALDAADLRPENGRVVMDIGQLRFVDHRALMLMARYARARDADLVLVDPRPGAEHLVGLLADASIRIERSR